MSKEIDLIKNIINEVDSNLYSVYGNDPQLLITDKLRTLLFRLDTPEVRYFFENYEQQSQRIAELEKQLKNAIVPKFKVGQEIWEITPLMSWKIKRIECIQFNGGNGDVVMEIYRLGHEGTDDYNCCIMPIDNDRFFATEKEAQAKLEELKGK